MNNFATEILEAVHFFNRETRTRTFLIFTPLFRFCLIQDENEIPAPNRYQLISNLQIRLFGTK